MTRPILYLLCVMVLGGQAFGAGVWQKVGPDNNLVKAISISPFNTNCYFGTMEHDLYTTLNYTAETIIWDYNFKTTLVQLDYNVLGLAASKKDENLAFALLECVT